MIRRFCSHLFIFTAVFLSGPSASGAEGSISFTHEVMPILKRSCAGCHEPGKKKGKLDVTSFAALSAGGKTGKAFIAGEPDKSLLVKQVSGPEPEMPAKGEKLSPAEVAVLSNWVKQGANDDSPAPVAPVAEGFAGPGEQPPDHAPVYELAPVITALACAPDGKTVAVAGFHEILRHQADGTGLIARLPSGSPRITCLVISPDGKTLAAAGGSPGEFGQIEFWDDAEWKSLKRFKVSHDTLFGLTFSPGGDKVAVACADHSAIVISVADGKELAHVEPHTDWALGTSFTLDGNRIVTASRDKLLKRIQLSDLKRLDEVNEPVEPISCLARHPLEDVVVCGGATGMLRVYRVGELQQRSEQKKDANLVKELEHQPGTVNALAFSADGSSLAVASNGEVRVYRWKDGNRTATLSGHGGPVFAIGFSPDAKRLYTGGYDGHVRIFDAEHGTLVKAFVPVPMKK